MGTLDKYEEICVDGYYGLVDKSGNVVVPPEYYWIHQEGKYYFCDFNKK